jgi:hypothetical protein
MRLLHPFHPFEQDFQSTLVNLIKIIISILWFNITKDLWLRIPLEFPQTERQLPEAKNYLEPQNPQDIKGWF